MDEECCEIFGDVKFHGRGFLCAYESGKRYSIRNIYQGIINGIAIDMP